MNKLRYSLLLASIVSFLFIGLLIQRKNTILNSNWKLNEFNTQIPLIFDDKAVNIAVIGDYGMAGKGEKQVAELVKGWQPDAIITLGDNNYPSGEATTIQTNIGQYYDDYIDGELFFPSLGNHDWLSEDAKPYLDYFAISESKANTGSSGNERYYDFVQGPIHFFVLDSDKSEPDGTASESRQAVWLQGQLAKSSSSWKVVYFHHPPYSSGVHGSSEWMQWPFSDWGADAVLSGHEHSYERLTIDNIPYFINGLGGRSIRRFSLFPVPGSQVRYNNDYGAMRLIANESQLVFTFFSIENPQTPIDVYTIQK